MKVGSRMTNLEPETAAVDSPDSRAIFRRTAHTSPDCVLKLLAVVDHDVREADVFLKGFHPLFCDNRQIAREIVIRYEIGEPVDEGIIFGAGFAFFRVGQLPPSGDML